VPQLTLFDPGERLLADDERGRITYIPGFIDAATAAAWFAELRDGVTWRSERRMMYDREVDVPRLMGHYRLDPPSAPTPSSILQAAARIDQPGVSSQAPESRRCTHDAVIAERQGC
jgi:hypothetical protein